MIGQRVRTGGRWTSVATLLGANLLPLIGVVALDWGIHSVLVIYWVETAIVGAATVKKITLSAGEDDPSSLPSIDEGDEVLEQPAETVAGQFVALFGLFWVVHGFFTVLVFPAAFEDVAFASPVAVLVATVGISVSHYRSYRVEYVAGGRYRNRGPVTVSRSPWGRVYALHAALLFGFFLVGALGSPLPLLVLLILLKTGYDARQFGPDAAAAETGATAIEEE